MTTENTAVITITDSDVVTVQAKLKAFAELLTPAELGALRMASQPAGAEQSEVSGLQYEWWNPWSWSPPMQYSYNPANIATNNGANIMVNNGANFRG